MSAFKLDEPVTYIFEYASEQLETRKDLYRPYGTSLSALSKIVTRVGSAETLFRRVRCARHTIVIRLMGAEETHVFHSDQADRDQFIRYALSN